MFSSLIRRESNNNIHGLLDSELKSSPKLQRINKVQWFLINVHFKLVQEFKYSTNKNKAKKNTYIIFLTYDLQIGTKMYLFSNLSFFSIQRTTFSLYLSPPQKILYQIESTTEQLKPHETAILSHTSLQKKLWHS